MTIKNFGTPEPEKRTPAERTRSLFDPVDPADHEPQSVLGERLYVEGEDEETDTQELSLMIFGEKDTVDKAAKLCGELVNLYERASRNPTKSNVIAFTKAVTKLFENPDLARAALALQTATLAVALNQIGKGRGASPFNF